MKVYLSGKMRGRTEFGDFHEATKQLRLAGHIVFNPAEKEEEFCPLGPDEVPSQAFLRAVFELDTAWICRHADVVALLPGLEKSKGACAEKALAEAIGLQVNYMWYRHSELSWIMRDKYDARE